MTENTEFTIKGPPLKDASPAHAIIAILTKKLGGSVSFDLNDLNDIDSFVMTMTPQGKVLIKAE